MLSSGSVIVSIFQVDRPLFAATARAVLRTTHLFGVSPVRHFHRWPVLALLRRLPGREHPRQQLGSYDRAVGSDDSAQRNAIAAAAAQWPRHHLLLADRRAWHVQLPLLRGRIGAGETVLRRPRAARLRESARSPRRRLMNNSAGRSTLSMRFRRYTHIECNVTHRKRAALERKHHGEQEAMPLFAELIAQQQPAIDAISAEGVRPSVAIEWRWRDMRAADWRRARSGRAVLETPPSTSRRRDGENRTRT